MAGTRKDIAKLNGPWADELLWYARAVRAMQARNARDRTSWTYFGAIHGINIQSWLDQQIIGSAQDLPSAQEQDFIFNQCQHAGWFFPPWHRGYLAAFEKVLDDWIQSNGGPNDWALPYWNYLDDTAANARSIPPEFLATTLPDGSPNPLADVPRNGATVMGPQTWIPGDIALDGQTQSVSYTAAPGTVGYGGAISGFANQGNLPGALESNPHNLVHVMIGGPGPDAGWMSDPDFAALDPIFWMHHCNIDRLWAAWLSDTNNQQETSDAWKNGPFPRQFVMPNPAGGGDVFTPGETLPGGALEPIYDNLTDGTGITPTIVLAATGGAMPSLPTGLDRSSALMGANDKAIEVSNTTVSTNIIIENESDAPTAGMAPPVAKKYFLNLEGVRGSAASGVLVVSIVLPADDGGAPTVEPVDTVVFFGLAKASSTEGSHAGNGLSVAIDFTDIARRIGGDHLVSLDRFEVKLSQPDGNEAPITVQRVSVFAQAE